MVTSALNILEENFGLLETRRFELKYIDLDKAKETLGLVVQGEGRITDQSSRAIIVKGRQGKS